MTIHTFLSFIDGDMLLLSILMYDVEQLLGQITNTIYRCRMLSGPQIFKAEISNLYFILFWNF